MSTPQLVEHFFRHEYGRLVATLSRRVGVQHLDIVEDAVQSALMTALENWKAGLPDSPSAWLFRVAHNRVLSDLRKDARRQRILKDSPEAVGPELAPLYLKKEMQDDLLRMLFVCCDDNIPPESQLVFALKTLCGFSVEEIAFRLFSNEATIYKRLQRAKLRLRDHPLNEVDLNATQQERRRPAVNRILYVLFTEGHLSSHADISIRRELCDEAIRLAEVLAAHPVGHDPQTYALLALMHLHTARMPARQDALGGLLLLEEQDRAQWDQTVIHTGLAWLAKSAEGDAFCRYHAEAAIAAEHCLASSFAETRWDRIVDSYEMLEQISPSALHRLNRAVAVAEWKGPEAGLGVLEEFEPPSWLKKSYVLSAVLADLHGRAGHADVARTHRTSALNLAPTAAVKAVLQRRWDPA